MVDFGSGDGLLPDGTNPLPNVDLASMEFCGTKDRDESPSASLLQKLGIEDVTPVLRSRRLRWYGHEHRVTSCIKFVTNLAIPDTKGRWRPRKTWSECVKDDVSKCGLSSIDPQNRDAWTSNPIEWDTTAPQYKHDDVIKWKHFPRYWPFVRGIHRSRWIPRTKASDAELWCFLWSTPE